MQISNLLRRGAENAIKTDDLMRITGYSVRDLRVKIAAERKTGELILSKRYDGGGFFLPSEDSDIAEKELLVNIGTLVNSIREMYAAMKPMQEELKRIRDKKRPSRSDESETAVQDGDRV